MWEVIRQKDNLSFKRHLLARTPGVLRTLVSPIGKKEQVRPYVQAYGFSSTFRRIWRNITSERTVREK